MQTLETKKPAARKPAGFFYFGEHVLLAEGTTDVITLRTFFPKLGIDAGDSLDDFFEQLPTLSHEIAVHVLKENRLALRAA